MTPTKTLSSVIAVEVPIALTHDLSPEQRKIAERLARKLHSAMSIQLPFVYVEKDGKRFYTLSAKQGAVIVDIVVTTDIPK